MLGGREMPSPARPMQDRPWHAQYDEGIAPSLAYEEIPIPRLLDRAAERAPDATAIWFLNARLTYRELAERVARLAGAMAERGVKKGTRVAIHLPNLPQTIIAYYAALRAGGQVVLTNPLYMPREIVHQWNDADCRLAVTADFLWDQKVRSIRDQLPVEHYIVASIPEYLGFPLNLLAPLKLRRQSPPTVARVEEEATVARFKKLVQRSAPLREAVETSFDDIAVLQYTGGTTGVSKGAVLTHRNLSSNVQQITAWFHGLEYGREVMLTALPLFHVFGMTVGMNWAVHNAAAIALIPNPRDTKAIVNTITKRRVTVFPGVPAMFNCINDYPGIEGRDVSSIKSCFSGSAPIPPDVLERFEKLTGARIIEGFGLSETSPVTHVNPLSGLRKIGSIGMPVSDTDARIVDVDDPSREVGVGEEGELLLAGPQVMREYWNAPEQTEATIVDGWLHTGDLAVIDNDGYFKIVGRKKDMINCSGLKVFPDEVDAVLAAHEDIVEAATIGVPHPTRGETVKSFVVLQPGRELNEEALRAFCREQLAAYKVPREVEFLDELPKSTVLKVLRRELRDREIARRKDAAEE